ncbi:MAG TPA: hypothetical protein VHO90_02750 [Bacteroidales bacterium]|nr:hypothetical protein [Bacteroidales bacterium]
MEWSENYIFYLTILTLLLIFVLVVLWFINAANFYKEDKKMRLQDAEKINELRKIYTKNDNISSFA